MQQQKIADIKYSSPMYTKLLYERICNDCFDDRIIINWVIMSMVWGQEEANLKYLAARTISLLTISNLI